jgi:hypothetical protein
MARRVEDFELDPVIVPMPYAECWVPEHFYAEVAGDAVQRTPKRPLDERASAQLLRGLVVR